MTPSSASVAEVRRPGQEKERFFTTSYSWSGHKYLPAERRNRCRTHCKPRPAPQEVNRRTPLFRMVISRPLSPLVTLYRLRSRNHLKNLYTVIPLYILRGDADHVRCARYKAGTKRTINIRATATIAFFLLPLACHTRSNFPRSTGSLRIATHEFSMRVALMNPGPMPVICPLCSVSPVESSLQVSPTKLAIFFPLVNRERSSPSSRTRRMAVNQPIPGRLRAIV